MRGFLSAAGRVLVTAGILLLLFVAYQLWGTGLLQARAQDNLRSQLEQTLDDAPGSATTTTAPGTPTTSSPTTTAPSTAVEIPPNGDPIGLIKIPRIGMSQVVVEGVDVDDLRKGPGHYPATPLPGQAGNAAIAGHRTTYGAPFGDLEDLVVGDKIQVTTVQGTFTYKVSTAPFVVSPDAGEVLQPTPDPARPGTNLATLTLTTCHPKYSAAERLIVQASLVLPAGAQPLAPTTGKGDPDALLQIDGLGGETASRTPAVIWGMFALLVGLGWWYVFHRYPRWYVWFLGAVPFLIVLFVFFTYLERLLPSNY
jgi:sortase A